MALSVERLNKLHWLSLFSKNSENWLCVIYNWKLCLKRSYRSHVRVQKDQTLPENQSDFFNPFESLESLDLRNNYLKHFPAELEKLKYLKSLNVSRNFLSNLESSVNFCLKNLSTLDLFQCGIEEISLGFLSSFPSLAVLNLNSNKLQFLPNDLDELENLELLSIEKNCFIQLPGNIG